MCEHMNKPLFLLALEQMNIYEHLTTPIKCRKVCIVMPIKSGSPYIWTKHERNQIEEWTPKLTDY
jgi:hypothetical protein